MKHPSSWKTNQFRPLLWTIIIVIFLIIFEGSQQVQVNQLLFNVFNKMKAKDNKLPTGTMARAKAFFSSNSEAAGTGSSKFYLTSQKERNLLVHVKQLYYR